MSEGMQHGIALAALLVLLAGCGQKGPLYLPERGGEVVTRPARTPPPGESSQSPNTPRTIDSPQGPANPAPEVTKPEEEDPDGKHDGANVPPP
jgi:predicted small lipoprotein YifL